jgi:hypothetical protein
VRPDACAAVSPSVLRRQADETSGALGRDGARLDGRTMCWGMAWRRAWLSRRIRTTAFQCSLFAFRMARKLDVDPRRIRLHRFRRLQRGPDVGRARRRGAVKIADGMSVMRPSRWVRTSPHGAFAPGADAPPRSFRTPRHSTRPFPRRMPRRLISARKAQHRGCGALWRPSVGRCHRDLARPLLLPSSCWFETS